MKRGHKVFFLKFKVNKNNHKTYHKCHPPLLATKLIFHLKSSRTTIKSVIPFILLNSNRFLSYVRRLSLKRIVLKNFKKTFKNKLCGVLHTSIKGSSLLLYKILLTYQV